MRLRVFFLLLALFGASDAFGWGPDGHSIVAEIAQHRLSAAARSGISQTLGSGVSLASISSWADDVRDSRPDSYNWHFVDIPIANATYDPSLYCKSSPKGDCIVAELNRLKNEIRCAPTAAERADALRFAVHFVGDIHQPLHTVEDATGGNQIHVATYIGGATCTGGCTRTSSTTNLHTVWDSTIIQKASWDWGAMVTIVEKDLPSDSQSANSLDPKDWAEETHLVAQKIWPLTPKNGVIDEEYYIRTLPHIQRQLGLAGVRLARYLNDVYTSNARACPGR